MVVYAAIAAIILGIGIGILIAEIGEDPDQLWEERGQITAIIAFALAPLGGAGVAAPSGVGTILLQLVYTVLGIVGVS